MLTDPKSLAAEFARRGPWATGFEIGGTLYGSSAFVPDGALERQALAAFPGAREIVELGSLECGRTRFLAGEGRHVVCVEGRIANIERAAFIRELFGLDVHLHLGNLEQGIPASACDLAYAVGILYHLPRPWELLAECAALAPALFLWTHVAADVEAAQLCKGMRFQRVAEFGKRDPLSGLSAYSLWPTRASLLTLLERAGYAVEIAGEEPDHPHGPALTAVCRRRGLAPPAAG